MIDGTNLNQLTGSRQLLRAFGGINETYSCSEAELSAALNFSGRGFPALQTRALRKKVRDVEKVNGMYHLNGLLICRGTGLEYAPAGGPHGGGDAGECADGRPQGAGRHGQQGADLAGQAGL